MKDHQIHQGVVSTSFLRLAMAILASHFWRKLRKGGGILWHIRIRGTQNRIQSALATIIDGSGWFLAWWLLFSRTTPKTGNFSVSSVAVAAGAAVTAKIEKKTQKSYAISILGFPMALISKMRSVFLLGCPQIPTRASPGELWGGEGGMIPIHNKR